MKGWKKCPKCGKQAPQSATDNQGWYKCSCGNLFSESETFTTGRYCTCEDYPCCGHN